MTANAIFLAPVPPGPVTVDVSVLRNGRNASQVATDLRVAGQEQIALRAHGVFGVAHDIEHRLQDVVFPEVPGPHEVPDPPPPPPDRDGPWGDINFHDQTIWRPIGGTPPWDPNFRAGPARASWCGRACSARRACPTARSIPPHSRCTAT